MITDAIKSAINFARSVYSAISANPTLEEGFLLVDGEHNEGVLVGVDMPLGQEHICDDFVVIRHPKNDELMADVDLEGAALRTASRMIGSAMTAGIVASCPKVGEVEIIEDDLSGSLTVRC